jgi:mono/diheme cytochrome c family protein
MSIRFLLALFWAATALAAELPAWGPFVERDFPFFSSVLDARKIGSPKNLTPRGLILNFPNDLHVCFDIDLVRVAAIWQGAGVTPVSMSQGSYTPTTWGKKAPEGQDLLPQIVGQPIFLSDPLPDPRDPGADPNEVGRGPLLGAEFKAINFSENAVLLEYSSNNNAFQDRFTFDKNLKRELTSNGVTTTIVYGPNGSNSPPHPKIRWPEKLTTTTDRASTNDAYRIENIALPLNNSWRRNIRLADVAFFSDGRAAAITFDGDVWLIDGLNDDLKSITWRRFTSGLHEPLSIAIRNDEIFVFDRNGIWRILDTDKNGEADRHELFCNRFTQTAETREFANSMKLLPDGSFVIAKPGQTGSTVGKDSGKILHISADGKDVTTLAHGFRQPFLGVNSRTGLITASDQQGHYIPSTPVHTIRGPDQFFGFRPTILPKEKTVPTVAEPLVWIPHSINASAANEVWLGDRGMGPLNNTLIHLGYYRSEIFNVLWDGGPNAAVVSFTRDLQFAPLSAAVHPKNGSLFVIGFQLWGASAPQISGLARIRYIGGESAIPRRIFPMREGLLIDFNTTVAESSLRPENFSAERWNYRRSSEYGSPHFKPDGSKGQEAMFASSVYLSKDRRSIFIGIPDMQPVMQMRLGWSLASEKGLRLEQNAYLTPRDLQTFAPEQFGFASLKVDLNPRAHEAAEKTPITIEEGRRLADLMGCAACHSADGSTLGKVGPSWKGLAGSRVRLANNQTVVADADYLRESIKQPAAKIVKDFDKSDAGMPSYEGVLQDNQIEALVLYIQSLR